MYLAAEMQLQPGDRVALYTDGIIEARRPDGTMLGTEGLCLLLDQHRGKSAADQIQAILDQLTARGGPLRTDDDVNLLIAEAT
jgi:serine phosphatase RsbU (regulator of sigma subunit)